MYIVVLSVNDNEDYLKIVPYAFKSWKTFFPEFKLILCYVTATKNKEQTLKNYCDELKIYNELPKIPSANQAKLARFYEASLQGENICVIHDVDSVILQRDYLITRLNKRRLNEFLLLGSDFYTKKPDVGKTPMGYMTGEGNLFKLLLNSTGYSWLAWLKGFAGYFDKKINVCSPFKIFSDESLIYHYLQRWNGKTQKMPLGYAMKEDCVCRWRPMNLKRLYAQDYIEAHHLIPVLDYRERYRVMDEYLNHKLQG